MLLFWSGQGILVLFIFISSFIGYAIVDETVKMYVSHPIADDLILVVPLLLSSLGTFALTKHLDQKEVRQVKDDQTGEVFELKPKHTLYFINIRYWVFIFLGLGLFFLYMALTTN
jgi:hypothetical protein